MDDSLLYQKTLRPLLFSLPAEMAHGAAMGGLRLASLLPGGSYCLRKAFVLQEPRLRQRLLGCDFPNPVGLAAGFDKDGRAVCHWEHLGFGFCEIGTVTAHAQPGNPRPRLYRLPEDQALINRLGFNNDGAQALADRLERIFHTGRRPGIPLGINIGKSRDTPLERATEDYLYSLARVYEFADYLVVNVSSPNTPGLRDLQEEGHLRPLLEALLRQGKNLAREKALRERALLVKFSPDLEEEELGRLIEIAKSCGVAGAILTNTTVNRVGLRSALAGESGGLSGKPLRDRATALIRLARGLTPKEWVIIGSGGIFSAADAWEKLQAGASLVQVYTGLVYEGPALPKTINRGLLQRGFSG